MRLLLDWHSRFRMIYSILKAMSRELGKPIGSDSENKKSTFPKLLGLTACHDKVQQLTNEAIESITAAFGDCSFLESLAYSLVNQENSQQPFFDYVLHL